MSVFLQIEIPDELAQALDILSNSLGMSLEEILMDALEEYVDSYGEEDTDLDDIDMLNGDIPSAS